MKAFTGVHALLGLVLLLAACRGPSRPTMPAPDGARGYSVSSDTRALSVPPTLEVKPGRGQYTLAAFLDRATWQRFATAAALETELGTIEFPRHVVLAVSSNVPVKYVGWRSDAEGGVLIVERVPEAEGVVIRPANRRTVVLVVVQREHVRRVRLAWMVPSPSGAAPLALFGGKFADTLVLPSPGSPASPPWAWVELGASAASAFLPADAKVESRGVDTRIELPARGGSVAISRIHEVEYDLGLAQEIAEDVASQRCKVVVDPWLGSTPGSSLTECTSEQPAEPPTTKLNVVVRDRIPGRAFSCVATFVGDVASSRLRIETLRSICDNVESADDDRDPASTLPSSLRTPDEREGFTAGSRLAPSWFDEKVRWNDEPRALAPMETVRRIVQSRIENEIARAVLHPVAVEYLADRVVRVSTEACQVELTLSASSRNGSIWGISAVSCNRASERR